jgi:L-lactate dehydrogenase complex protein LldF
MTIHPTSPQFKDNAHRALEDRDLQKALGHVRQTFIAKRAAAAEALPEFEALRDSARDIKAHTLQNLDLYIEAWEERVTAAGGHVHYARDAAEAREAVLGICRRVGARTVTKGKSMISEEIGLNQAIEAAGLVPVETDLGEYIVQLRGEVPSHIIAPAVHLTRDQVEADFRRHHVHLDADRDISSHSSLQAEARGILRERFLAADVGVTATSPSCCRASTSCWPRSRSWCRRWRTWASCSASWPAPPPARRCRSTRRCRPGRSAPRIPTGRTSTTSCSSTTAGPRCWARASRTCCAASAAAPA